MWSTKLRFDRFVGRCRIHLLQDFAEGWRSMEDFVVAGGAALIGLAIASGFIYLKRYLDEKSLQEFCAKTGLTKLHSQSASLLNLSGFVEGKKVEYVQCVGSNHPKRTCQVAFSGSSLSNLAKKSGHNEKLPLLVIGRRKIGLIDLAGKAIGSELSVGDADFEKEFVVAGTSSPLAEALLQKDVTTKLSSLSGNLYFDITISVGSIGYSDRGFSFDGDYFKAVISILCLLAELAEAMDEHYQ